MDAGLIPVVRGHPPDAGEIPPAPLPPEALARIRLPNGREQPQ
jgi:hypothetical protein